MTEIQDLPAELTDAAKDLIEAFGRHDTARYFASFEPGATFVFHTHPVRLENRGEYEKLWHAWEEDGFTVLECVSSEQRFDPVGADAAVFTHRVRTRTEDSSGTTQSLELETIVFARQDDNSWLAVHEHLSPALA